MAGFFAMNFLHESYPLIGASLVGQAVKNLPTMKDTRVQSLDQENPWRREWLQYSCLENPMDTGAWQATPNS